LDYSAIFQLIAGIQTQFTEKPKHNPQLKREAGGMSEKLVMLSVSEAPPMNFPGDTSHSSE
jgi:hypothetical protein